MNIVMPRSYRAKLATLIGTTSFVTLAQVIAQQEPVLAADTATAQATPEALPENVLVTGSLIRGTVAVGVPVVNFSPMDFATTGALTTADLFKNVPSANFSAGDIGTTAAARVDRGQKINLRNLDTTNSVRELLLIDGMRFPAQGNGLCAVDPSVIPSVALDHVDILIDGASATYGSDALSGVVNLILKRNYDGAQTQLRYTWRSGGGPRYQASQLWGRTWDGGQITLSYEWYNELPVKGNFWSSFSVNHSPWGYDDRTPLGSASPGIISTAPFPSSSTTVSQQLGTSCGYLNVPGVPTSSSLCYSIPRGIGHNFTAGGSGVGPTSPFSASTLNWASFSTDPSFAGPITPTAGTRNEYNPFSIAYYSPFEERNGGAITVDQRLTKDISFFGEGFYSNRRSRFLNSNSNNPSANSALTLIAVPTWNPYYPTGGAPTNLRVSYDMSVEMPPWVDGNELAARYQAGLNIALPKGWESQISYSETTDSNYDTGFNDPNKNAVSAALGWTINPVAPSGTAPAFGTWTRPASVPYLNLFCDPHQYQCNSPATLNYVTGGRVNVEKWWINQKDIKADGPLFDLPGGTVKMAVGASLIYNHFFYSNADNTSAANLVINPLSDSLNQNVWAAYTQVNIPVFGDNNALPGLRRVDIEASWRHDQYNTVGGTSNPKFSMNWSPIDDLTFKGSWGSNFRAPGFSESSFIAKSVIQGRNLGGNFQAGAASVKSCGAVGGALPDPNSGAGKLQHAASDFAVAMAQAGASTVGTGYSLTPGCVDSISIPGYFSPGITSDQGAKIPGLLTPGGLTAQGGEPVTDILRSFTGFGRQLTPELAHSWSAGFDYTPTNFLRGLDVQATWYQVKIDHALQQFGGGGFNDSIYADPTLPFVFPMPADLVDSNGQRLCHDGSTTFTNGSGTHTVAIPANLIPSACAPWMQAVSAIISNPKATVQASGANRVYFVNDAATFNVGWIKLQGLDFNVSYDWDMGNLGAFNVGIAGTKYLSQDVQASPTATPVDIYHSTVGSSNAQAAGVATLPTLIYRARLGWSSGNWTSTLFMDYRSHYFSNQGAPPNVNNACLAPNSTIGGGTFPCFQNGFTNAQPNWFSFDLSLGYDTGDEPANDYLKKIGIQVIIQDLMDKHPAYQYVLSAFPCSCGGSQPAFGRQISLILTKTW